MIVLDASAVLEWLLQTRVGTRVEARVFSEAATLHAPHLVDIEKWLGSRGLETVFDTDHLHIFDKETEQALA